MTQECEAASSTAVAEAKRHTNLGAMHHLEADLAGRPQEYEAALAVDPDNATALNNLGSSPPRRATSAAPSSCTGLRSGRTRAHATAYANLGNALAGMGDLSGALTASLLTRDRAVERPRARQHGQGLPAGG